MKKGFSFLWTISGLILVAIVMEWLARTELVSPTLVPSPTQIFTVFIDQGQAFLKAFLQSYGMTLVAFVFSSLLAIGLALLLQLNDFLRRPLWPFIVFFQTVPIVAIAPLLVIYLGFGWPTVISAAFIVSFFPVFSSLSVGLNRATQSENDLFKIMKASALQKLIYLQIPTSLPHLLSGLKSSAGLSVVGVVAGEFVAGGGLGGLIDSARLQQRVDIVFTCLILLCAIGLSLSSITDKLFNLLFKKYFVRL